MTAIASRSTKLSNIIAFEDMVEYGDCRETVTVTVEAGMDVGAALELTGGKYVWIDQAAAADATAGDHELAVLIRGPAGVTSASLLYDGVVDATGKAAVAAQLLAQGIVDRVQV